MIPILKYMQYVMVTIQRVWPSWNRRVDRFEAISSTLLVTSCHLLLSLPSIAADNYCLAAFIVLCALGALMLRVHRLEVCFPILTTCGLSVKKLWTQEQSEELSPRSLSLYVLRKPVRRELWWWMWSCSWYTLGAHTSLFPCPGRWGWSRVRGWWRH